MFSSASVSPLPPLPLSLSHPLYLPLFLLLLLSMLLLFSSFFFDKFILLFLFCFFFLCFTFSVLSNLPFSVLLLFCVSSLYAYSLLNLRLSIFDSNNSRMLSFPSQRLLFNALLSHFCRLFASKSGRQTS